MELQSKIYVAGHRGLVGSAIVRKCKEMGFFNIITRTHQELDLTDQRAVREFFEQEKPDYVFLAAAKVGGIYANMTSQADFIYENLMIEGNVIKAAHDNQCKKLLFLGSTCIYPKMAAQPIKEEELLSGYLEPTNEAYAIAKIAGLKMCYYFKQQYNDSFISCMPTNLYGQGDNFDLKSSHVLPALIRKFHEAKVEKKESEEVWGSGAPLREFLHVDDMADASVFLMQNYDGNMHVNIGSGEEVSIRNLAEMVKEVVGYQGDIRFNTGYPDGTPRKLTDTQRLRDLGWQPNISLKNGLAMTYQWFCETYHP